MDFPSSKPSETSNCGGCSQDTWSLCPLGLIGKIRVDLALQCCVEEEKVREAEGWKR